MVIDRFAWLNRSERQSIGGTTGSGIMPINRKQSVTMLVRRSNPRPAFILAALLDLAPKPRRQVLNFAESRAFVTAISAAHFSWRDGLGSITRLAYECRPRFCQRLAVAIVGTKPARLSFSNSTLLRGEFFTALVASASNHCMIISKMVLPGIDAILRGPR